MLSGGKCYEAISKNYPDVNPNLLSGGEYKVYKKNDQDLEIDQKVTSDHSIEHIKELERTNMLKCIKNLENSLRLYKSDQIEIFNSHRKEDKELLNQLTSIIQQIVHMDEKAYFLGLSIGLENRCVPAVRLLIEEFPKKLYSDQNFFEILSTTARNIKEDLQKTDNDYNILFDWEILPLLLDSGKINPSVRDLQTGNNILDILIHNNDINGAYRLIKSLISKGSIFLLKLLQDIGYTLENQYRFYDLKEIPRNLIKFLELIEEVLPDKECTYNCLQKYPNNKDPITCKYKRCYIIKFLEKLKSHEQTKNKAQHRTF
ncbi:hypothetical protein [Cardinium endosymbiont of Bemisia tabaci]|uniref:hypothetical protein n=1 Tax=Cardinium endosymbiont of Bemisia tabaci TaxID=672794 RepID=UPI0013EE8634|nr:hypothetical protein [Cardinium endosymbiont of Bemisia tabaci]